MRHSWWCSRVGPWSPVYPAGRVGTPADPNIPPGRESSSGDALSAVSLAHAGCIRGGGGARAQAGVRRVCVSHRRRRRRFVLGVAARGPASGPRLLEAAVVARVVAQQLSVEPTRFHHRRRCCVLCASAARRWSHAGPFEHTQPVERGGYMDRDGASPTSATTRLHVNAPSAHRCVLCLRV